MFVVAYLFVSVVPASLPSELLELFVAEEVELGFAAAVSIHTVAIAIFRWRLML